MALFATLTVFFLAKAIKSKGIDQKRNYALSGFFGLIILLVTAQGIIILIVPAIVLLAYLIKDRNKAAIAKILYFAIGIALAFVIIAVLGYAAASNPLYIFSLNSHVYSASQMPKPQLMTYIRYLFSFNVAWNLSNILAMARAHSGLISILQYVRYWLFNASAFNYAVWQTVGLFGYATVIAVIYLFVRRNLRFWLPGLWFLSTLLYLGWGTVSITRYIPIDYAYSRFTLLFMPALALIMGFAAADICDFGKNGHEKASGTTKATRYALNIALAAVAVVLLANSVLAIRYIDLSQFYWVYNLIAIGNYIETLPSSAIIYSNYPIEEYSGFSHTVVFIPENCTYLSNGSYVVANYSKSFASECNLSVVFTPPAPPRYLKNYDMFRSATGGTFYNITLYYHK